jgi:phosphoribosylglycinamide formyltransferase-1
MEQAEWKILPMAIDLIANGKVSIADGHVVIDGYDDKVLSEL